jgi:Uncharacterised nucleotidyltransferase
MVGSPSLRAGAAPLLLELLAHPQQAPALDSDQWDLLVRVARSTRLLAELGVRMERSGVLDQIPARARAHMISERAFVRYLHKSAEIELRRLSRILDQLDVPAILLKGAAYIAQRLPIAEGRSMGDVDVMVPRPQIDRVEVALKEEGWVMASMDAYDERYYREWTHEIPPLRFPGHPMELDVHHTILQQTARLRPIVPELFAESQRLPQGTFRVLCAEDQLLHASVHLFQDSDCANRLRDLVDIDGLLRHFASKDSFWDGLITRAKLHGLGRPLFYAAYFCERLLGTPIPPVIWYNLESVAPNVAVRWLMSVLVPRALLPSHPDRELPVSARFARNLLFVRGHWLRMPPLLLARHLAIKGLRRLTPPRKELA